MGGNNKMMQNDEKAYGVSVGKMLSVFDAGTFVELGAEILGRRL